MTNKKKYKKSKNLKFCALFLFPFALASGVAITSINKPTPRTQASENYLSNYYQDVSPANSNFTSGSFNSSSNSLSSWSAIETDSKATGMFVDVGSGSVGEDQTETPTFSEHKESYMLSTNPGAHSNNDSRILMINSKENNKNKNNGAYKGYRSDNITLEPNSYYIFSVSAKAMLNGEEYVNGSIYISGMVDKDDNPIKIGYENFRNSSWKEYYFYIATGEKSQTVTIDLYLGTNGGSKSQGAVFFDDIHVERWSNNKFMSSCYASGYKNEDIKFIDLLDKDNKNKDMPIFLVNEFPEDFYIVDGTQEMNFDFEDEITGNNSLGDHWKIVTGGRNNASARVMNVVNMQDRTFKETTGYDFVGYDLDYNNTQSLVLYTHEDYTGYIGVQSDNIHIDAQGVYKVSLKMKVAGMESGSFYLKVTENENIYSYYPDLISKNSEDNNYYALNNGQTTGISANTSNSWTNDYQTVEFYLKGNPLFNTSVNLEFWLGDSSTNAKGCVIIDDVMVERTDYSSFSSASNKLELGTVTNSNETFTNSSFNSAENNSKEGLYPLTASNWTTDKEDEDLNESGVITLFDDEQYKAFYLKTDKNEKRIYDWAGINPNNDKTIPNNVYMMFNRKNSYQSILSTSTTINSNSYYKLSFDYYTQDYASLENASIKVEVIDDNGIILFSQNKISSPDAWSKMEIYLHTAETVDHTVQVKVSLGEADNKVGGFVYLDNFNVATADNYETEFKEATYKTDLTNYYLNLNSFDDNKVHTSPAYSLSVDTVYDNNYNTSNAGSVGGIVSGQKNNYGIKNDNNLLVLTNVISCKSTLTSNYKLSLKSDTSYYLLTFDLATFFGKNAGTDSKEHKCHYGLSVTINGYQEVSELVSTEQLKNYKIYIKNSGDSTPTVAFTLVSDCENTIGTAVITNINFTPSSEDVYTALQKQAGFNQTIFKAEKAQETSAEDNDDNDTETQPDTNDTNKDEFDARWLLISSIIMGVALIIAIVGFVLRKIKIKKIEKIKKESYDRKLSVNHDVILAEAQKRRDKEIEDLQKAKNVLIDEKTALTEAHKEYVKAERETNNGVLSRDAEREFKKFNSNISRLDEKINIIKEKMDYCMTPDYLLTLQRKIVSEEDEKFNAEKKARKLEEKQNQDLDE